MKFILNYNDFNKEINIDISKKNGEIQDYLLVCSSLIIYNIEYTEIILNDQTYILGIDELDFNDIFSNFFINKAIDNSTKLLFKIIDRKRDEFGNVIKENDIIKKYNSWYLNNVNDNYNIYNFYNNETTNNQIFNNSQNLFNINNNNQYPILDIFQSVLNNRINIFNNQSINTQNIYNQENINQPTENINDTLSNNTLLNDTLSNNTLSNGTLLNDTLLNDTLSNDTLLNGTLLNDTLSNDTSNIINLSNQLFNMIMNTRNNRETIMGDLSINYNEDNIEDKQDNQEDIIQETEMNNQENKELEQMKLEDKYNVDENHNENISILDNINNFINRFRNNNYIRNDIITLLNHEYDDEIPPLVSIYDYNISLSNLYDNSFDNNVKMVLTETQFNNLEKIKDIDKESKECLICLEMFDTNNNDEIIRLICKHCFHCNCIKSWLCLENNKCPVCRLEIDKGNPINL